MGKNLTKMHKFWLIGRDGNPSLVWYINEKREVYILITSFGSGKSPTTRKEFLEQDDRSVVSYVDA